MQYGYNSQQYLTYNKSNIVRYTKIPPPRIELQSSEHAWKFYSNLNKWKQCEITPEYLSQIKLELIADIHEIRKFYETAGVNISGFKDFPTFTMGTDSEDTLALSNTILSITLGIVTEVNWKTLSGIWILLNNNDIIQLASIVAKYIEDCFDVEMSLITQVQAMTTMHDINIFKSSILSHWPDRNKVIE